MHARVLAMMMVAGLFALTVVAEEGASNSSNLWGKVKEEGKRAVVIGKIRAAFADRKDIPGRYIRVRFDGKVVQLAGFVPNKEIAKAAEDVAASVARPDSVQTFWSIDEAIDNRDAYKTYAGEQAGDVAVKAKVLASLNGPDVQPQLKNAAIIHVNVNHGKVTVYIVADAAPDRFDLEPHIKPIAGVTAFACKVVKAY